jgi:Mn2+/Fe2+ NRAMP family transporter
MNMTHWLRILGSLLIASGVGIFALGALVGIALYIYSLFVAEDYLSGVTLTGIMLITLGFTMRKFFKETPQT